MLIQFVVENFLSFEKEAVLNMIATKNGSYPKHICQNTGGKNIKLLRLGALYGANAAGKSNFVKALDFAKNLLLNGTKGEQLIPIQPFRLNQERHNQPSKFDFTFKYEGIVYNYGFKVNSTKVCEEWLFATPNKVEVRYFERITDEANKVKVEFGASLAGKKSSSQRQFLSFVGQGTRPNQLFLTEAFNRNVAQVKPIIHWFSNVLEIIDAESRYNSLEIRTHKDKPFTEFLGNFLRLAGTGIEGITTHHIPWQDEHFREMPEELKQKVLESLNKGPVFFQGPMAGEQYGLMLNDSKQPLMIKLKTHHKMANGQKVLFDLADESEGTQRLINLLPALASTKSSEKVWVIDELDRRLHPLLSRMFIEAYLECDDETPKGQLIFTTHDTNLLNSDLLRKDEIWFVEKDAGGASYLYSLVDFRIQPSLNIEKGYLQGRFGAIPFIGDLSRLGWDSDTQES